MTPIEHIRRNVLRLTQAEMAALTGVHQATVSRWETGAAHIDAAAMAKVRERACETDGWSDALFFSIPLETQQPASAA